ncbi:MAG: hypothetical protein AAF280_10865 [Pseudomonadota bacterium]
MTQQTDIKYRADGSIDIDHYTQIGRRMRSEQAVSILTGRAKRHRVHRKGFTLFGRF